MSRAAATTGAPKRSPGDGDIRPIGPPTLTAARTPPSAECTGALTDATPIAADGLIVVASGRRPEQPLFVVRAGSRGNLTLEPGRESGAGVVWSRTRRGPYMPTPLAYGGILYVLANNGVFDAYELGTGKELYRERIPHLGRHGRVRAPHREAAGVIPPKPACRSASAANSSRDPASTCSRGSGWLRRQ